jgi:hypothetical protein
VNKKDGHQCLNDGKQSWEFQPAWNQGGQLEVEDLLHILIGSEISQLQNE